MRTNFEINAIQFAVRFSGSDGFMLGVAIEIMGPLRWKKNFVQVTFEITKNNSMQ